MFGIDQSCGEFYRSGLIIADYAMGSTDRGGWKITPKPDTVDSVMCVCTTPFVTMRPDETLSTHKNLQRVVSAAISNSAIKNVYFDLDQCAKCDPGGLLLLRYAGEVLSNHGRKGYVTHSGPSESFSTIVENLNHLWEKTARRVGDRRDKSSQAGAQVVSDDGKYLLRAMENRNEMVREISEWADIVKKGANARPEEVACWEMQIAEVATNTFQHGKSERIWVSGHFNRMDSVVQLAAIDYGATIPAVIGPDATRQCRLGGDGDLIAFACEPGVTSRCVRQNQGAGLISLIESVATNRGRMQILSRNGLFHVNKCRKYRRNLQGRGISLGLSGTLIILCLNVG